MTRARATLRGIRRVALVVSFQGDAALEQYEKAPIIKDVEQRLVQAGISVVSVDQVVSGIASGEKTPAPADYLYVYATVAKTPLSSMAACSISIEVNRRVRLNGSGEAVRAVIWKTSRVFMVVTGVLRDSLRSAINDELEKFVMAYGAANHK